MDLSVELVDFFHIFRTKYAQETIKMVGKKLRLGLINMADSSVCNANINASDIRKLRT